MAKQDQPKGISARLDQLLAEAMPVDLNERQLCLRASVSTSFFTDLRKGREPGIDKVERLARAAGLKLSDLIERGEVPLRITPSNEELEAMLKLAQSELGGRVSAEGYPSAIASSLRAQLQRYAGGLANANDAAEVPTQVRAVAARSPRATKRAARE